MSSYRIVFLFLVCLLVSGKAAAGDHEPSQAPNQDPSAQSPPPRGERPELPSDQVPKVDHKAAVGFVYHPPRPERLGPHLAWDPIPFEKEVTAANSATFQAALLWSFTSGTRNYKIGDIFEPTYKYLQDIKDCVASLKTKGEQRPSDKELADCLDGAAYSLMDYYLNAHPGNPDVTPKMCKKRKVTVVAQEGGAK